jgi:1-acyl-sn-glycerol-3-phosphate acyltransferase
MVDRLMDIFGPEHFPASAAVRRTPARAEEEFWKTLLWLPVNFIQAVSLAIVCGTVIPVALVAQKCSGQSNFALWMARNIWAPIIIAGGLSRLSVSGQENVSPGTPALVVSNHQSYADIPILYRALPVPLRFTAKRELEGLPFIGKFMRALGMVLIDRSTPGRAARAVLELGKVLQRGEWTVVFPEGTRSVDGVVGPFAAGSLAAAIAESVEILPVAIAGSGRMLSKGGFRVRPSKIQVRIGKPISTIGLKQGDRSALASKARESVEMLLAGAYEDSVGIRAG